MWIERKCNTKKYETAETASPLIAVYCFTRRHIGYFSIENILGWRLIKKKPQGLKIKKLEA